MKLTPLGNAAVILLCLSFPVNDRVSAQIIAITAGTLIDPDTGTEKAKQTILIDGGTIVAVGSELQIPSNAKRSLLIGGHLAKTRGAKITPIIQFVREFLE